MMLSAQGLILIPAQPATCERVYERDGPEAAYKKPSWSVILPKLELQT